MNLLVPKLSEHQLLVVRKIAGEVLIDIDLMGGTSLLLDQLSYRSSLLTNFGIAGLFDETSIAFMMEKRLNKKSPNAIQPVVRSKLSTMPDRPGWPFYIFLSSEKGL